MRDCGGSRCGGRTVTDMCGASPLYSARCTPETDGVGVVGKEGSEPLRTAPTPQTALVSFATSSVMLALLALPWIRFKGFMLAIPSTTLSKFDWDSLMISLDL